MELQQLAWSTFVSGKKVDPHQFLGLHEKGRLIRIWRPKATELSILVKGEKRAAKQIHSQGIFSLELENPIHFFDYLVPYPKGIFAHDPYAFLPTFTRLDEELFSKGKHWSIYRSLGSHPIEHQGIKGVKFAVWAPCAIRVVLMCDLNDWSQVSLPMRPMGSSGVWELFVPKMALGECYLFGIETIEGEFLEKADPYAFQGEMRPGKRSVVATVDEFSWNDHQWLHKRKKQKWENTPINIYELHLGSWKRKPQKKGKRKEWREFCNYEELAHELALYCKKMGLSLIHI